MPLKRLINRKKEKNKEKPVEITLKLIKDQKQAKNNMHSETINHLIP